MAHHRNLSARNPRAGSYAGERDDAAPPFRFYGYEEDLVEDRDRLALQPYNSRDGSGRATSPGGSGSSGHHRTRDSRSPGRTSWTQDAGPSTSDAASKPRNYYENVTVGDHSHHIIIAPKGDTITVRSNKIGSHSTEWMGQINDPVTIQLSKDQVRIAQEETLRVQAASGGGHNGSAGPPYRHGYGHGRETN